MDIPENEFLYARQGKGKYFMNCRQQKHPSPCPLFCKPTNLLISSSGLVEIHRTSLTTTKPTPSQKLCPIYKSLAILSARLYWCHPCITMNSQHVSTSECWVFIARHTRWPFSFYYLRAWSQTLSINKSTYYTNILVYCMNLIWLLLVSAGRHPQWAHNQYNNRPIRTQQHRSARSVPVHFRVARHKHTGTGYC